MEITALVSIIGALVTVGGLFIQWKKAKSEVKVLDTQGTANVGKTLSDAALLMSSILNEAEEQNKELRLQSKEARDVNRLLEGRLGKVEAKADEAERLRKERTEELAQSHEKIEALQAGMEALNRQIEKDTEETRKLRDEVQTLRSQVTELQSKNDRYVRINKKLIQALEDAEIPLPDFNGDLSDTMEKWTRK